MVDESGGRSGCGGTDTESSEGVGGVSDKGCCPDKAVGEEGGGVEVVWEWIQIPPSSISVPKISHPVVQRLILTSLIDTAVYRDIDTHYQSLISHDAVRLECTQRQSE